MDVNRFLLSLLHSLSGLDFVKTADLSTEAFIVKGRVLLEKERFLQVYYNELTGTTAFALIENGQRIWGIDYDNLRGWHVHPVHQPGSHVETGPMSIEEITSALHKAWTELP